MIPTNKKVSRTVNIPDNKMSFVLNRHFNISLGASMQFYRGISGNRSKKYGDKTFINPQKLKRTSQGSSNIYYILFDELGSWKGYPSRSKSLIFTNHISESFEYGEHIYEIFPNNKANIAWAPMMAFILLPYAEKMIGIHTAADISNKVITFLKALLNTSSSDIISTLSSSSSGIPLLNKLRNINLSEETLSKIYIENFVPAYVPDTFIKQYKNSSAYEMIDDLFDPEKNHIKHGNISQFLTYFNNNSSVTYEIWTDGLCYLEEYIQEN